MGQAVCEVKRDRWDSGDGSTVSFFVIIGVIIGMVLLITANAHFGDNANEARVQMQAAGRTFEEGFAE